MEQDLLTDFKMDLEEFLKVKFDYVESNYNGSLEQDVLKEINKNL